MFRLGVLALLCLSASAWAVSPAAGSGGENSRQAQKKPYVILISIDGLGWDYPDRFPMRSLEHLAQTGARAERLLPVWPTLTFPNHYTIATGLLPKRHGIVANNFIDRERGDWYQLKDREAVGDGSWYGGRPIWVAAETRGMVAASFYWVGSEADVMGVRPSHWRPYDGSVAPRDRVQQVLDWLSMPEANRPHMITLYFEDIDDAAHWYGIGSPEFQSAVTDIDQALMVLFEGIAELPHGDKVSTIVVSDHGQTAYASEPPFILDEHIALDGLIVRDGGAYVHAWQKTPDPEAAAALAKQVNAAWEHGQAVTRQSAPEAWHMVNDSRFPDLVFQADGGRAVLSSSDQHGKIIAGDHGWPPSESDMHGVFMMAGPGVPAGQTLGPVSNLDIYPLMLEILELPLELEIDGEPGRLSGLLYGPEAP